MADVQQALSKYRALQERREDLHRLYRARDEEFQEARRRIQKLTANLDRARQESSRDEGHEKRTQAQLEAEQAKLNRLDARRQEIAAEMNPLGKLERSCREFLESAGATIESLEVGYPVANQQTSSVGVDTDG